ncbi:hypothetical protein GC102_11180 [Paenibacillus sp. LMG 31460]|uniref:Transposase n=1 Tax=Paenibacillus germinis TaxID=2654979 RepID=A0ABX1YZB8_9BACL|nr:hypothetical protein [Paenibacillus germinis]
MLIDNCQIYILNRKNERITTSHLVVGIDIVKETHVAQATNFRGSVLSNRQAANFLLFMTVEEKIGQLLQLWG